MKTILFILVIINIGIYAWATQATPKAGFRLPEAQTGHNLEQMALVEEKLGAVKAQDGCLRIGPFSTQQTLGGGKQLLVHHGYGFTQQKTTAREEHSYQVVVGPFRSEIARSNIQFKLEDEGVSFEPILKGDDYYLYLRAFATESQALSLISELEPLSLPLNLERQVRTLGPFYWLEVQDVVTPERRGDLEQLNWGDTLTVLTPIVCPSGG